MGQNPATKHTEEFRRETADYIISSGRPITECCKELGLNSKTVSTWVVKRRRELGGAGAPTGTPTPSSGSSRRGCASWRWRTSS